MIRPAATALLLLAAAAATALAAEPGDDDLRRQIVGAWGQDEACSTGSLTFNADGTFAFAQPGNAPTNGTWSITDGVLSGEREGGGKQPDALVAFADATMTMTETEGSERAALFHRCPA